MTLIRLYPRAWRERYEAEFLSLLAARPPSVRDRLDIVSGAIDARLHPQTPGSPERPRPAMQPARLAAAVSLLAGVTWLAWTGLLLRDFRGWGAGQPDNAATIFALSFIAGLALAAAHVLIVYAARASTTTLGGSMAAIAAICFTLTALGGGFAASIALIASAVAATALAGRAVPGWTAAIWAISSLISLGAMSAFVSGGGKDVSLIALLAPFGCAWILIGVVIGWRGVPATLPASSDVP